MGSEEEAVQVAISAMSSRGAAWWRLSPRRERWVGLMGLVVVAVAAIGFPILDANWPFRYRKVKPLLESVFASDITIAHYRRVYFPHPGFVANGLTMRRRAALNLPPIGTAQELKIVGNWGDVLLFRKRMRLVYVRGMQVEIPPAGSTAMREEFPAGSSSDFAGPTTPVETLHLQDTLMEILHADGSRTRYPIHDLSIHNVQRGQAAAFDLDMENASPLGRVRAQGSFGPLNPQNLGGTPLQGEFVFSPAELDGLGTLHGTVTARGKFAGKMDDVEVSGDASTPDFAVADGHPVKVTGTAQCTVNALNGDVVLHRVDVRTGETVVDASGTFSGSPKRTRLEMRVDRGRVQDLLRPFLHEAVPVTGPVWLTTQAEVGPGGAGKTFLQRLTMNGAFHLPQDRLTRPSTAKSLAAFSAREEGASSKPGEPGNAASASGDALSSLEGPVQVRNGIASTGRLVFRVQGASARLKGTYELEGGKVHLTGPLRTESDLSHATTGWKSLLLKPFAPFFRGKKAGAVVNIAVTGVPHHYKVGQDVLHNK